MIKNKVILVLVAIFLLSTNSFGQKIKYKDYKNDYSTKTYPHSIQDQKYSPQVAGLLNYLIPSTGYYYIGEPLRGVCVLGGMLITVNVAIVGLIMSMSVDSETGQSSKSARTIMYSGFIATGLIQLWSTYDVVKITKIKNLAHQEKKLTINLQPDLYIGNVINYKPSIHGLRLTINF